MGLWQSALPLLPFCITFVTHRNVWVSNDRHSTLEIYAILKNLVTYGLSSILFVNVVRYHVCFAYWRVVAHLRADGSKLLQLPFFISCNFYFSFMGRLFSEFIFLSSLSKNLCKLDQGRQKLVLYWDYTGECCEKLIPEPRKLQFPSIRNGTQSLWLRGQWEGHWCLTFHCCQGCSR